MEKEIKNKGSFWRRVSYRVRVWFRMRRPLPMVLTADVLREMNGEKIYIFYFGSCPEDYEEMLVQYYGDQEQCIEVEDGRLLAKRLSLEEYGKKWLAYGEKPVK